MEMIPFVEKFSSHVFNTPRTILFQQKPPRGKERESIDLYFRRPQKAAENTGLKKPIFCAPRKARKK